MSTPVYHRNDIVTKGRQPRKSKAKAAKAKSAAPIKGQPHQVTKEKQTIVMLSMLNGFTQEQTARLIGIHPETLRTYYREEIDHGKERLITQISGNLVTIATQNRDIKAALTASIFFLKTRAGYRERERESDTVSAEATASDQKIKITLKIGDKNDAEE